MAGLCLFSISRLCSNFLVLFVTLNNTKFLGNIWQFISRPLFTHVALKIHVIFLQCDPQILAAKPNGSTWASNSNNLIPLTCRVDLSMHILMSYFCGTKVQMTTALLWCRNYCSFSHVPLLFGKQGKHVFLHSLLIYLHAGQCHHLSIHRWLYFAPLANHEEVHGSSFCSEVIRK